MKLEKQFTKFFALTSGVVIILSGVLLSVWYRQAAVDDLHLMAQRNNAALTQAFSNAVWGRFAEYVSKAGKLNADQLRAHPNTAVLRQTILKQMEGISVLKVKIYDLNGLTVFSTEPAQIGADKSGNSGYLAARAGTIASELTHRNTFSAFEQVIEDRDVLSSYLPIRGSGGIIEGVFEVYYDVTDLLTSIQRTQYNLMTLLSVTFFVVYMFLVMIVRYADKRIRQQQAELTKANEALTHHRDHLEEIVAERTTEVGLKSIELERALEQEREYSSLQREFVSMVSHEFRTPLAIIDAETRRLKKHAERLTPAEVLERGGEIHEAVERLTALIESALTASSLEAGKIDIKRTRCNLAGLVTEVVTRQQIISKEHQILVDIDDPELEIFADPMLLGQIITNLLSNAVKYSPGCPTISVAVKTGDDDVSVTVSDQGLGVDAEDLPRLFERFYRAKTSAGITGTGIGLYLVKQFTEIHNGSVEASSTPGQGSTFTLTLPIDLRVAEPLLDDHGEDASHQAAPIAATG